jgi:hypothetical protein
MELGRLERTTMRPLLRPLLGYGRVHLLRPKFLHSLTLEGEKRFILEADFNIDTVLFVSCAACTMNLRLRIKRLYKGAAEPFKTFRREGIDRERLIKGGYDRRRAAVSCRA